MDKNIQDELDRILNQASGSTRPTIEHPNDPAFIRIMEAAAKMSTVISYFYKSLMLSGVPMEIAASLTHLFAISILPSRNDNDKTP